MDLIHAARHLRHPFVFRDAGAFRSVPLAARGLIGDGFTAALVAADGAIDWMCLPRFDSPSVFARMLDAHRGGAMAVRPATFPFESVQAYDPGTNVLETLFTTSTGAARLVDSMPWSNDPRAATHELHRRLDCPEGEVTIEVLFDPRFDYGRDVPRIDVAEHGVLATGAAGDRLSLSMSRRLDWVKLPHGGARAVTTIRRGTPLWSVLSWGEATDVEHAETYRPFEHLRLTRRRWREWVSHLEYDGPWRHLVVRSALALKLLMYAPTGAVVAAPTTSLPEWIGGPRNWDYRYTWARDAALAVRAMNLLGFRAEARDFYHFVRDAVDTAQGLQLMYAIDGGPVPAEVELGHLAGHEGSRPVRIGNGARDQLQLDTTGAMVDAAHLFEKFGGRLTHTAWHTLAGILTSAETTWSKPDHGIWEPRHGVRHNVHSKLMSWLAMDRGSQLATSFGRGDLCEQWSQCARAIHDDICTKAIDPTGKHFTSVYGELRPDAALLQLSLHGFLPDGDPRLVETVRWVRQTLGDGAFLYRYRDEDGVAGPEGAFVLCGFWLAEALALQGDVDEAHAVFSAHAAATNHLDLLAEEVDPADGSALGNFPQAFSHLGLINAAMRLDLALRLRDEGSRKGPHLVGRGARRP